MNMVTKQIFFKLLIFLTMENNAIRSEKKENK